MVKCKRCNGDGWLEPIGPCSDGSYVTSRMCPACRGDGVVAGLSGLLPEGDDPPNDGDDYADRAAWKAHRG